MSLTPGIRLGPYEVIARLGAGGMGEVYRARDSRLGRDVAIKVLPAGTAADSDRLARFEREAQTLAALNHPNIATLYGLEESAGAPHLVLELVEGETLASRLDRGPLPLSEALSVADQVAAAIEAAHASGIVHRDLKPGNVMLTPGGTVKVLDFGLARADRHGLPTDSASNVVTRTVEMGGTVPGMILGTAAYMSPEQARGHAVDRRTDVWSFGCLLFECLAGRGVFQGDTIADVIARILEREPDWSALPEGTPPGVRAVLKRCLRRESESRPRDMRDVRLELREASRATMAAVPARNEAIAVLPFENLSGPDDEYFADGVTDEILNALGQLPGLRVAARTSSFAFKGRREDLRSVGEKLGVTTVLEGTVRRAGSRLRVTVRLVQVSDGYQSWSERYDRELTDVFELQDEIARTIAARLRGGEDAGAPAGPRGTRDLEAYDLFLRGRALITQRGRQILSAMRLFERALERDPDYAEALGLLADGYRLQGTFNVAPALEVMPRARQLAERALALRPGEPEATATLASVMSQFGRDLPAAEVLWQRNLGEHPGHTRTRGERAIWSLGLRGMPPGEAISFAEATAQDDPLSAWAAATVASVRLLAGQAEPALESARRAIAIDPDSFIAQWVLGIALGVTRRCEEGQAVAAEMMASSGRHIFAMGIAAWLHHIADRPERVMALRDEIEARARYEYMGTTWRATLAAMVGDDEAAARHLAAAEAERDPVLVLSHSHPPHRTLARIGGFDALMSRLRIPA